MSYVHKREINLRFIGTEWGRDITADRSAIIKHIGNIIDAPVFYDHLSAIQNINIHLSYMGLKSDNAAQLLIGFSNNNEYAAQLPWQPFS